MERDHPSTRRRVAHGPEAGYHGACARAGERREGAEDVVGAPDHGIPGPARTQHDDFGSTPDRVAIVHTESPVVKAQTTRAGIVGMPVAVGGQVHEARTT